MQLTANKLRLLIEKSNVPSYRDLAVTISVGGAIAAPRDTEETLLIRVDRCLYQSKADGRNRVTIEE